MKLNEIISMLYEDDLLSGDISLRDEGNGIYIDSWNTDKLGAKPSEQSLLNRAGELQAQFDLEQVALARKQEYPATDELVVALWEKVVEGRTEAADVLEVKRQAVKAKHPKNKKK